MQLIFVLKYVQIAGQSFVTFIYFFYFSSNAFSESTYDYLRLWRFLSNIPEYGKYRIVDIFLRNLEFFPSNHSHSFIHPRSVIEVTDFGI